MPLALFGSERNAKRFFGAVDAFLRSDARTAVSPRVLRERLFEGDVAWTAAARAGTGGRARPPSDLRRARSLLEDLLDWLLRGLVVPLVVARFVVVPPGTARTGDSRATYPRRERFARSYASKKAFESPKRGARSSTDAPKRAGIRPRGAPKKKKSPRLPAQVSTVDGAPVFARKRPWHALTLATLVAAPYLREVAGGEAAPARTATAALALKSNGGVRVVQRFPPRPPGPSPPGAASLRDAVAALRCERRRRPALVGFGAGVDGLWRALRAAAKSGARHGLRLDVARCFDAVDHCRLLAVLGEALAAPAYRISGGKRCAPCAAGAPPAKRTRVVSRAAVLAELAAHVGDHGVDAGRGRTFRQVRGVPQGSVASALLVDVYYGAFEASALARVPRVVARRRRQRGAPMPSRVLPPPGPTPPALLRRAASSTTRSRSPRRRRP